MKRLIVILAILLLATNAFGAGECLVTPGNRTELTAELIWSCTGDAVDGSIPNTPAYQYSSLFYKYPYTLSITVENLSTDENVTDNSDVYLYDKSSGGADILSGGGVDSLDDDARNFVRLSPNPLTKQVWLGVANQAVASGVYKVILTITK